MEIIFGWFVLIPLAVVVGIIYLLARLIGAIGGGRAGDAADEARMVQEMYAKLDKLERRVDNLETLLMETEEKEAENGKQE
jgi:phage shock protein B